MSTINQSDTSLFFNLVNTSFGYSSEIENNHNKELAKQIDKALKDTQGELKNKENEKQGLINDIKEYKKSIDDTTRELNKQIAEYKNLKDILVKLDAKKQQLQQDNKRLERKNINIALLENKIVEMEDHLAEKQVIIEELRADNPDLTQKLAQISELKTALEEKDIQIGVHKHNINDLNKLKKTLAEKEKIIENLEYSLDESKNEVNKLRDNQNHKRSQLISHIDRDQYRRDNNTASNQLYQMEKSEQINTLHRENKELIEKIKQLEQNQNVRVEVRNEGGEVDNQDNN